MFILSWVSWRKQGKVHQMSAGFHNSERTTYLRLIIFLFLLTPLFSF